MAEQQVNKETEAEVLAKLDAFAELPDAPPKRKFRLSWVGWVSVGVVVFWLLICVIGPSIAPFHEMDMEGDDSFLDAYSGEYGTFVMGTDYLGRDTFSRVLFGARNTIGISLAATLCLYGAFGLEKPAALNGPQFLTADVLAKPLAISGDVAQVPTGSGLGIEVDEDKITELMKRTRA